MEFFAEIKDWGNFLVPSDNPYDPECKTCHAGKVFRLSQADFYDAHAIASDGSSPMNITRYNEPRYMLCLWDLADGLSVWLPLQSKGEHTITPERKYGKRDSKWINNPSRYWTRRPGGRHGAIWRLGRPGEPFRYEQRERRGITLDELFKTQEEVAMSVLGQ